MTDRQERARIRAARYAPNPRLSEVIESTLSRLPTQRRPSRWERPLRLGTAVAALALLLTFAAPPLVRAAAPFLAQVFGAVAKQIRVYQKLPQEDKQQLALEEAERDSMGHDLDAKTEFEGVVLTIPFVRAHAPSAFGEVGGGEISMELTYSKVPPFDPNWVQFSLTFDGRTYPMQITESLAAYRTMGVHMETVEDWQAPKNWESEGNSDLVLGMPTTWLHFPVDDWKLAKKTDVLLRGALEGGKSFEIAFAFDPELAHTQLLGGIGQSIQISEQMNQERLRQYEAAERAAAVIGISGSVGGKVFEISELSLVEDAMHIGWMVAGESEANSKRALVRYGLSQITVDGNEIPFGSGNSRSDVVDGALALMETHPFHYDAARMPRSSLICFTVERRESEHTRRTQIAFRYDWEASKVQIPKDAAEMQTWILESDALKEALHKEHPRDVSYDLRPLNLTQAKAGLTMTLTRARLREGELHIEYEFVRGALPQSWGLFAQFDEQTETCETLTIDDAISTQAASSTRNNDGPSSSSFILTVPYHWIGEDTQIQFRYPAQMIDKNGQSRYSQAFDFSFALDRTSMNPEVFFAPVHD